MDQTVDLETWKYPLLFVVGGVAGTVDTIAGGGGIITLPVLLNLGFPVPVALGTNKLQASFGSVSAAWHYGRAKLVDFRTCSVGVVTTLLGAAIGTMAVRRLDSGLLQRVIPWLLAGIVIYTIFRPSAGEKDRHRKMSPTAYFIIFGLLLGFYDGFLGPGTGSFWTISMVTLLGFNFLRATAVTKVMNATSNVVSLALFLAAGTVHFRVGFAMGAGQLIGAKIGSRLALTRGARFVRPIFLTMVFVLMARLLWTQYAGSPSRPAEMRSR